MNTKCTSIILYSVLTKIKNVKYHEWYKWNQFYSYATLWISIFSALNLTQINNVFKDFKSQDAVQPDDADVQFSASAHEFTVTYKTWQRKATLTLCV